MTVVCVDMTHETPAYTRSSCSMYMARVPRAASREAVERPLPNPIGLGLGLAILMLDLEEIRQPREHGRETRDASSNRNERGTNTVRATRKRATMAVYGNGAATL